MKYASCLTTLLSHSIDSDKFVWDVYSTTASTDPESFARKTCDDIGLPSEMEPAIAHRIRETLMKMILAFLEDPESPAAFIAKADDAVSEIRVNLVAPHSALEMVGNLWKRARPNKIEDQAYMVHPRLPTDKMSNARAWESL